MARGGANKKGARRAAQSRPPAPDVRPLRSDRPHVDGLRALLALLYLELDCLAFRQRTHAGCEFG